MLKPWALCACSNKLFEGRHFILLCLRNSSLADPWRLLKEKMLIQASLKLLPIYNPH